MFLHNELLVGILLILVLSDCDGTCSGTGCQTTASSARISTSSVTSRKTIGQTTTTATYGSYYNSSSQKNVSPAGSKDTSCEKSVLYSCKAGRPSTSIAGSFILFGSILGYLCVHYIYPLQAQMKASSANSTPNPNSGSGYTDGKITAVNIQADLVLPDRHVGQRVAAPPPLVGYYGDTEVCYNPEILPSPAYGGQWAAAPPPQVGYYGDVEERYASDGRPYPVYGAGARFGESQYDDNQPPPAPEPGDGWQRFEPVSSGGAFCALLFFLFAAGQKTAGVLVLLAGSGSSRYAACLYVIDAVVLCYSIYHNKYVPGSSLYNNAFPVISTICGCYGVSNSQLKVVRERRTNPFDNTTLYIDICTFESWFLVNFLNI
jgi:hypothetical protein